MTPKQKTTAYLAICDIHAKQLAFMLNYLTPLFPMTAEKLTYASPIDIALLDSIGHRYAKLQSLIGEKVFALIPTLTEENPSYTSYKDLLSTLERLKVLESVTFWEELREVRNDIVHDYPEDEDTKVERLNYCLEKCKTLLEFYNHLKQLFA